jgi:16S rRNA G966 N2-methylase RsmD
VSGGYSIIRAPFDSAAPRLEEAAFDVVLLDPPYLAVDPARVLETAAPLVARNGRLVLEHARRRTAPERAGGLVRIRNLIAGDSGLAIYRQEHGR